MNFEILWEALEHGFLDSIIVFPFLILTYILIELIERKANFFKSTGILRGTHAPLFGGLAGIFPQCGISVMSAKLYDKDYIKAGTLLAVFIATSDEAFAVLLTSGKIIPLLALIGLKLVVAVAVGYIVNAFIKKTISVKYKAISFSHEEYCRQCGISQNAKNKWQAYLLYPVIHALKTLAFIFAINFLFGLLVHLIGESNIIAFMQTNKFIQPFLTAIVGLIPNCASSILITQLYTLNGISFGSMFAGLSVNAGVGLAVILKNKQKLKQNLLLVALLYIISITVGLLLNLFI